MKTTCPNCSAAYGVADEKIPKSGAQIKCLKCGTFFVVMRLPSKETPIQNPHAAKPHAAKPHAAKPHAAKPHAAKPHAAEPHAPVAAPLNPPPLPELPHPQDITVPPVEFKQPGHSEHIGSRARGISAIRAQSGIAPPPPGPGMDASVAGADAALALELLQPLIDNAGGASKSLQKAGLIMWSAVVMTCLTLLVGVAITLTRYGIWDLTPYLPLQEIGIEPPRVLVVVPENQFDLKKPDLGVVFSKAISEGDNAIHSKDFSKAALEYNRALSANPGSREALNGLAKAYEGLGDREQALRTLMMAQSKEQH
jgi:predicted Zn finger-like uncharacterized protein